ncbi:hypothetical protein D3C74_473200 [compost metagenome]
MGAESVQGLPFLPFEFQLCMKSLPVQPPVNSLRSCPQPIRTLSGLYRVCRSIEYRMIDLCALQGFAASGRLPCQQRAVRSSVAEGTALFIHFNH